MAKPKKVEGYEDKQFDRTKSLYAAVHQVFQDMKNDMYGKHGWNLPIQKLDGCTMKLLNDKEMVLTYHRVESGTIEDVSYRKDEGKEILKEVEKELKKRFKKHTKKALKMKKIRDDHDVEQMSRIQADTSWMVGSSRYGHNARPQMKFFIRDTNVYELQGVEDLENSEI